MIVLNPGDLATIYQSLKRRIKKQFKNSQTHTTFSNRRITGRSNSQNAPRETQRMPL
ncbi:hypothetical protein LEP1GSC024_3361 [Leptospira noguchii str. 2001034031]|uniref:Uncharacterized protein n=1 Tax=Leptospira noguchii str. 2001034031 TaxID=1193053 RepID=M6YD76_9LEPT|nr:hypothetical protein LEP1GSC024_3361 [Leptospira noguchii str. 2001034031]